MRSEHPWRDYRQALLTELGYWAEQPQFADREISSIFFGGGTPSLAPPELIAAVIEATRRQLGLDGKAEITLEANPGTVDAGHFCGYRQAGVNRLSIGVQSLNPAELEWLERIHSPDDALAAFATGREAGFDNINLDLMYGLPGQTVDGWLKTLDQAILLGPEHLSCYQLTVEPHTRLATSQRHTPVALPDEEASLRLFHETRQRLGEAGYSAYEISNFARRGHHCRHNDSYWCYHDYIGIGAGAAGKWDMPDGGACRYSNIRSPENYIDKARDEGKAINSRECLDLRTAAAEAIWMGLRRHAGLSRQWFSRRFGNDVMFTFGDALQAWQQRGDLHVDENHLCLSETGLIQADSVATDLF